MMHTRQIQGKCVVTEVVQKSEAWQKGIRQGDMIESVDGLTIEKKIEKLKPFMRMCSSQRNFLENAYRRILDGDVNTFTTIKTNSNNGISKNVRLRRVTTRDEEVIKPGFALTKGKYVWYGRHPAGIGYIRIKSFMGRDEVASEFYNALEQLKNTDGLMVDVRENPGGFGTGQPNIIGRFLTKRTKVDIVYTRDGTDHNDFRVREIYYSPSGKWQYVKPAALLINSITGSASDMFTCTFAGSGRVITVGSTTHGNLTGEGIYVQLPCKLVVRISHGYICSPDGRIVEGNGTEPMFKVEYTINDIMSNNDPVIEKAVQELHAKITTTKKH